MAAGGISDERVHEAEELMMGLLDRMGVKASVEARYEEGNLYLEVTGDEDGMVIGKKGRTLEAMELLMNRMVNKTGSEPIRVIVDVDRYRKGREPNANSPSAGPEGKEREEDSHSWSLERPRSSGHPSRSRRRSWPEDGERWRR